MILSKGDSFVDVGANIGIFSSIIARYKPFLSLEGVYAFEANPDTFGRRRRMQKVTASHLTISVYQIKKAN